MSRDVLEELVTKFVYDVDQLGLQKYTKAQEKINKNTQKMIGLNSTLAKGLRRLFIGAGAIMGVQGLIKTYRDIDLVRRSIEGLTKSTQDWDYIQKEALRTGTGIEQVAKGYRNFYSAASMAGFDKSGIQDMYSDVLTASRAIGATQQQVGGALLALEQMLSKGRVSMEELRRQLGNALPGAFEIGAKAMGVTTQKFNEMVKKGISATEFVPKFTKELLNTYKEAFPEAVKSLDFALVNLSSSWKLFQYEIMNGSAGQGLAETINSITEFLRSPEAITIAKGIGQALNLVARALGFVVKHFRMILVIFGINMLSQLPSLLDIITKRLLYFNKGLIKTGGLLEIIGKAGFLIMRNFGWAIAIGAIIGTIAIALQDIIMYLKDPNALTLTRELVEKSPEFAKTMERIKETLNACNVIWNEQLVPSLTNFMKIFSEWLQGEHPKLGAFFEVIIVALANIFDWLSAILGLFKKTPKVDINDPTKIKLEKTQALMAKAQSAKTVMSPMNALLRTNPFTVPLANGLEGFANIYNYNIDMKIEGGQYSSPIDIANAVDKRLSSVIDRANMSTMADKPRYMSTMADKPR